MRGDDGRGEENASYHEIMFCSSALLVNSVVNHKPSRLSTHIFILLQWILITTSRMVSRTPRRLRKLQQTPNPSAVSRTCCSMSGAGGPSSGTSPRSTSCSTSTSARSPTRPSSPSSPPTTSAGWRGCTTSPWRTGGSWPSRRIQDQVKFSSF